MQDFSCQRQELNFIPFVESSQKIYLSCELVKVWGFFFTFEVVSGHIQSESIFLSFGGY